MVTCTSRRALLATVGAAAVVGCLGRQGTGAGKTPEQPDGIDTDWPMPHADAGRSNLLAEADGPTAKPAELWRVPVESTLSAPVVAGATLFAGTDGGSVLALDARDGGERWRTSVGAAARAPSVVGETVYVPTEGAVVALATGDGSEQWRTPAPAERDTLVADHGVYWVADATVTALDRADGSERWRTDVEDPWEPHLFASPDTVFVSSGVHGRVPWRLAPGTGTVQDPRPQSGHDFPREVFYRDGKRYGIDGFFETVQALPLDGTQGWSTGLPPQPNAAISGGGEHVYFLGDSDDEPGLYALSDDDGNVAWSNRAVKVVRHRPVAAGECVLARGDDALRCFDPTDGTQRWTLEGDAVGTDLAVVDDLLFSSGTDAVRALRPP